MDSNIKSECSAFATQTRNIAKMVIGAVKDDLNDTQAAYKISGSNLTISWLVGHLTVALDFYLSSAIGRASAMSAEEIQQFGVGAKPSDDPKDYPSINDAVARYAEISESVAAFIDKLDDSILDGPLPDDSPLKGFIESVREILALGDFHTGYHCGQISMLRAAQGLSSGFGM